MTDTPDTGEHPDGSQPDYAVGKGRPPLHTRFKKGHSGNKAGRPKRAKNMKTLALKELQSKTPVVENGKRKKIEKAEAMIKTFVNKAAQGDYRAASFLLGIIGVDSVVEHDTPPLSSEQVSLFERHLKNILGQKEPTP